MSSLRETVNARAYARAGRSGVRICHCDSCDAPPEPCCGKCDADRVPLNDDGACAMCAEPEEDEMTDAQREARIARLQEALRLATETLDKFSVLGTGVRWTPREARGIANDAATRARRVLEGKK